MSALSVKNLSIERGGRSVLHDVSFEAEAGEVLAIVGPNGAGKSSLLECIVGALEHKGEILAGGTALSSLSVRDRAKCVTYVPQRSALRAALSVWDVVAHGRYAHQSGLGGLGREDREAIQESIERMRLENLTSRSYLRLSMGEQQRVLIARALATRAKVLLLDEPTSALDVSHALSVLNATRALAEQGLAVVVVLHGLELVLRHADRALLLHEGRLVASGPAGEVITPERVREVYGVDMIEQPGWAFRLVETK